MIYCCLLQGDDHRRVEALSEEVPATCLEDQDWGCIWPHSHHKWATLQPLDLQNPPSLDLVKPCFFEMDLLATKELELSPCSAACWTDMMAWPMWTLAIVYCSFLSALPLSLPPPQSGVYIRKRMRAEGFVCCKGLSLRSPRTTCKGNRPCTAPRSLLFAFSLSVSFHILLLPPPPFFWRLYVGTHSSGYPLTLADIVIGMLSGIKKLFPPFPH